MSIMMDYCKLRLRHDQCSHARVALRHDENRQENCREFNVTTTGRARGRVPARGVFGFGLVPSSNRGWIAIG